MYVRLCVKCTCCVHVICGVYVSRCVYVLMCCVYAVCFVCSLSVRCVSLWIMCCIYGVFMCVVYWYSQYLCMCLCVMWWCVCVCLCVWWCVYCVCVVCWYTHGVWAPTWTLGLYHCSKIVLRRQPINFLHLNLTIHQLHPFVSPTTTLEPFPREWCSFRALKRFGFLLIGTFSGECGRSMSKKLQSPSVKICPHYLPSFACLEN